MQHAIKMDVDFPVYERVKDPVRLWTRIFDVSMNGTGIPENEATRLENARYRFDKISQKPTETVGEFYQRFLQHYDAMVGQGALLYNVIIPAGLTAEQQAEITAEQELKEEALKATSFIKKLDGRFKTMRDELNNAYDMGRDEHPDTLNAAFTMASRRRENGRLVDSQIKDRADLHGAAFVAAKSGKSGKDSAPTNGKGPTCWFCEDEGHTRGPSCKLLQKAAIFFQKNPVDDFMKKVKEGGFVTVTGLEEFVLAGGSSLPFGKFDVNLDNQSSVSLFHNAEMLTNIRKVKNVIKIAGVGKAELVCDTVGSFLGIIDVYWHPDCVANLLCFHDLHEQYGV
jgi:hypothetical protein